VRLGFAVAANFDPDILLVDEALAVGDLAFTVKCLNQIAGLRQSGTCIIFVSHSELQVREAAQRCLLLDKGQASPYDRVDSAFIAYGQLSEIPITSDSDAGFVHNGPVQVRYGGGTSASTDGRLRTGEAMMLTLECTSVMTIEGADLELRFWNTAGQLMTTIRSSLINQYFLLPEGKTWFSLSIRTVGLAPGRYRLAAGFRRDGAVLGWTRDLAHIDILPASIPNPVTGPVHQNSTISGPLASPPVINMDGR